ncbi:MAG: hypothetical protein QM530_08640 [Phycisphaerales bacterium]|nr:hypothetical protein [Phycisphaerales bacterium]
MSTKTKIETTLLLVDNDLNTLQEVPFVVPDADYIGIHGLQNIGGKCYFFYNKRQKKSDEVSFCGMQIDETDINKSKEFTLGIFKTERSNPSFQLKVALDSTSYLLFVEPDQKKQDNKSFYFGVFDLNLNKIWDKNVEMTTGSRYVDIYGITCKQQDKVFISYKHYVNEIKRESIVGDDGSRIPSYKTNILVFKKSEEKPTDIHINLGGKFVHSSDIIFNAKTNKVSIIGMYKNKNNGHVNGVYYTEMDAETNELTKTKITAFPQSMVELIKKDGFASKKESDPGLFIPYVALDPIIRENGSIDYLLEYRLLSIITYSNGKTTYTVVRYTYGTAVDAHFQDENVTFTRIPKHQIEEGDNSLLSFYPLMYHNKLILLYNDDKDNVDKELEKSPDAISNFKKSVLMAASIDENNKLSRDIIMDAKKSDNFVTRIPKIQKIDDNTLIFTQARIKLMSTKTRYGTLTIK